MSDNKKGSKFTFDNFEVTKSNSSAFEKAKHFAENADSKPLAIFGGTATGKTHLLYAVKNAIEQNSPDLKVILTTTADMVSDLTNIISSAQFEFNAERINQRKDLLHKSQQLCWKLMHDADFDIDAFKSYYKDVWTYFGKYIGLFDMDREDLRIVCYLNRIDTMLHCKTPVGLKSCEWNTCILFTHALIYTISSHDYTAYRGGFYDRIRIFKRSNRIYYR